MKNLSVLERERVLLNDKFIFFVISRFKICMKKVFGSPSCVSISWNMGGHSVMIVNAEINVQQWCYTVQDVCVYMYIQDTVRYFVQ